MAAARFKKSFIPRQCHTYTIFAHGRIPNQCSHHYLQLLSLELAYRAMNCLTEGYKLENLGKDSEQYIHRKALKALHVLFDMEVLSSLGVTIGP